MSRTGSEAGHTRAAASTRHAVVELCGLPGSGKSTLARTLTDVLTAAGVEVSVLDLPISAAAPTPVRAARRLGHAGAAALRRPVLSVRAAGWFASGRQSATDAAAVYVQWLAVQHLVQRSRRDPRLHLLEEGAVQTMWTALLRAGRSLDPGSAWALVPPAVLSDAVLLVDVPVETALARLARRRSTHSRTQQLAPDARRAELTHGHALLEELVARCPVPVLRVPAGGRTREQVALGVAGQILDAVTRAR